MAWSTPLTAVANAALTAAQWNASVRDNLLETAPAKATGVGNLFVSTGVGSIAQRAFITDLVDGSETTALTTYTDLATPGPAVSLTTSGKAMCWTNAQMSNSGAATCAASFEISGASAQSPTDSLAIIVEGTNGSRQGVCDLRTVTAGVNTYTMKYRVSAGTGTFLRRRIHVMGL